MSEENESALAIINPTDGEAVALYRQATNVAGLCKEIVTKTAKLIQGRKFVPVEGWQTIAAAHGCVASSRDVEETTNGIKAVGELRRMRDGQLIAVAEGFIGKDEPVWYGGGVNPKTNKPYENRPLYAKRAMAQTRAISRVCRSAFAHVVVMMNTGLSTTPAEEMDGLSNPDGHGTPPPPSGVEGLKARAGAPTPRPSPRTDGPPPHQDADFRADGPPTSEVAGTRPAAGPRASVSMKFGGGKGTPLPALEVKDLKWYEKCLVENVGNPEKARFRDSNQTDLDHVRAELHSRNAL